jgi:hypothetical protein
MPGPAVRVQRFLRQEAVAQFSWGVAVAVAALLLEGVVSYLAPTGFTTSGGQGDCIGVGSKVGALAVSALVGFSVRGSRWVGLPVLWASIVVVELVRFLPTLPLLAFFAGTRPLAPTTLSEWRDSAFLWWPLMTLVCLVVAVHQIVRMPRPRARLLAPVGLGGLVGLLVCCVAMNLEAVLPWWWSVTTVVLR